jgi:glutamate--cysteine ligase
MDNPVYELFRKHPRVPDRLVGLEVERMARNEKGEILHYDPDIHMLLKGLVSEKNWAVAYESKGNILGLKKEGQGISLEPGGQFELDISPQQNVHQVKEYFDRLDAEINSIAVAKNWKWIEMGFNPFELPDDMNILPNLRYELMDSYFKKTGSRGREMMRISAALQLNFDFHSEAEGAELLKIGFYLAPILNTMFANSPYYKRKNTGRVSERHFAWLDTDPLRTGFIPGVLEDGYSLKDYSKHITSVPLMYAFDKDGEVFDPEGKSLDELPEDLAKINALPAMKQIFTEVRLKPCCIEVRCFDEVPGPFRYAATALSVGLLYDDTVRSKILQKFKKYSIEDLKAMMAEGAEKGLKVSSLKKLAEELIELAVEGLKNRGFQEEELLGPIEELVKQGKTPADLLVEKMGDNPQI